MTIKKKILIPMIALIVICTVAALFATIVLFNNYVDGVMSDRVTSAMSVAETTLKSLEIQAHNASALIAKDLDIINAILNGNRENLIKRSDELMKDSGMEFCTIGDANGIALARPHKVETYGDDITAMPSVKSALSGESLTAIEEGVSVRVSLCSGTPIYDSEKKLIGIVVVGFRMDTDTYVDSIKALIGCETTVFLKDERLSTTVVKSDGTRAIGTKADSKVSGEVLSGTTYVGRANILDHDALTKYAPLRGPDGAVIGMLFVGYYMTDKTETIMSFVISGLIIMAVILIVGILIAAFIANTIEGQIRNLIRSIKKVSRKIESSTRGLTEIATNLADGSSKQAASIEETSASMDEAASMIVQTAEGTQNVATLAQQSKQNAHIGKQKMDEMVLSMNQIKESSNSISKIIRTIDDIAFQTNLLAINATVEAARAGEAGRSFSIVAQEVRNLAMRSAEAAADTSEIIEKNIILTQSGGKISGDVSGKLETMVEEFDTLNKLINEITAASEEHTNGIRQINIAVSEMEKVTQRTAAMAEEAAAASQDLHSDAITLDEVVTEASKLITRSADLIDS